MIGRKDGNGPQGSGINENVSFTLNTCDRHAVYAMTTGGYTQVEQEKSPTLMSRDYKDPTAVCCGIGRDAFNAGANAKFAPSIDEELQPPMTARGPGAVQQGYAVRRLTPTECARLQGFPDWWCSDLGTENPTEEEMEFWRDVFETHREAMGTAKKPKTDSQIRKWLANPHTDSAEYRMWGNGCSVPIVFYVLYGIAHFARL
jgi:DNA (cytosine-5)-methyltransferase 1